MAATIQDVVKANFVLVGCHLLGDAEELRRFREQIDTDVVMAGGGLITDVVSGVTEPAQTVSLNRDRITLELASSRSTIGRDYPSRSDLPRLAEIVGRAIECTDLSAQSPTAFGYNIDLVYDQTSESSASSYLGKRLFNPALSTNTGWQLVGGAGRMVFETGGTSWRVAVEPRFNDESSSRVFFSLNLHKGENRRPNEDEIRLSLEDAWDQAHVFVKRLDECEP